MNIDKQALRDIAESIEREEWDILDNGEDGCQVIVKGSLKKGRTYRSYQPVSNETSTRKVAAFIATFSPATALDLLDELDSANGYASAYEAEKWHYHGLAESEGERADRAEKRTVELEEIATDYGVKFQKAQDALKHQALLHKSQMEVAEKQVEELTMWVKRLTHSLRNARPDSKLHGAAMDYLSRNGLISVEDVLR
ncbi:ead/Ea22-like family protein [Salmonella enterica]|nr:ead/Ea22-like family protein [Salmonella enterica]EIV7025280.1 ead/Ea22-like family protein [Salmonella enterica]EIW3702039.1 ead/Ea22-like family protein [Salmonella enterica]EJF4886044.1 ead/Ea22-like family protein [Salmonella enterica]ELX2875618.1 ead/Ea22-like family protein [Salmonella enterica]